MPSLKMNKQSNESGCEPVPYIINLNSLLSEKWHTNQAGDHLLRNGHDDSSYTTTHV